MRKSEIGGTQPDSTSDAFPRRRRRDAWPQAQTRAVRYPQSNVNARRGIPRRGAR
jgi:hypothetical protein